MPVLVDKATIGDKLRAARRMKNQSQIKLADTLGVPQGTISRAESGHDLRVSTLLEIARALDLDVVLAPRRLRPLIESLGGSSGTETASIYTGGGEEPYFEDDRRPSP